MNICLIDQNSQIVSIYTETGIKNFKFEEIARATNLFKDCIYIIEGQQISYEQIYNTVSQFVEIKEIKAEVIKPPKMCVVHMGKGVLALDIVRKDHEGKVIVDKKNNPINYELRGVGDYRLLEELDELGFSDSVHCQGLVKKGKLKIATIEECQKIARSGKEQRETRAAKKEINILVDGKAEDFAANAHNLKDGEEMDLTNDVKELEVGGSHSFRRNRGASDESAMVEEAEGSLLPEFLSNDGEQ